MASFALLSVMFNQSGLSIDFCSFNEVVDSDEHVLSVHGVFAMDLTREHLYLHIMGIDLLEIHWG